MSYRDYIGRDQGFVMVRGLEVLGLALLGVLSAYDLRAIQVTTASPDISSLSRLSTPGGRVIYPNDGVLPYKGTLTLVVRSRDSPSNIHSGSPKGVQGAP